MSGRWLRLLISLGLLLGLVAGSFNSASASQHDPALETTYFPWVPNGAMAGGSGPFYGALTIQNLEDVQISVFASPTGTLQLVEPPLLTAWTVQPFGSVSFTLEQLGLSSTLEGTGVSVTATRASDGQPAAIAGVLKQAAPEPPEDALTGASHATVAGYTGLVGHELGTELILPIVQSNSGWNTIIRTTNFSLENPANVSIQFHEAGSGDSFGAALEVIPPGETWTLDLLASQIGAEWVGSAIIASDQPVGAVAERVKSETDILILNTSRPTAGPDTDLTSNVAPLILREWNHWNTGISIVNLADAPNPVTVTYYAMDGTLVDSDHVLVPPRGMDFIYTPSLGDGVGGFVGSALLQADHPFHGAVDQVKYFGDDEDSGHAMSYMVETDIAGPLEQLALPLVQKGDSSAGLGDTSGIQVFNPLAEPAEADVVFIDESGQPALPDPIQISVEGRGGQTIYTMFYPELPDGFQGSALIRVTSGALTAASNNVNYDVQYDGSASFNVVKTTTIPSPQTIVMQANPQVVPHFSNQSLVTVSVLDRFGRALLLHLDVADLRLNVGSPAGLNGVRSSLYSMEYDVRLPDSALGDRPVSALLTAWVEGTDVEEQLTITWQAPPVLAP